MTEIANFLHNLLINQLTIEFRSGQDGAGDAKALFSIGHVERRDGRMMRDLFGDVERFAVGLGVVPVAAEAFAQNRIVRFLESFGLLVETRQVEFHDCFHSFVRIIVVRRTFKNLLVFNNNI